MKMMLSHSFLRQRVTASLRVPSAGDWLATTAAFAVYLVIALPLAWRADLIAFESVVEPAQLLPLALRVIFLPALLEELLFRVLPNPHPAEGASGRLIWWAALLSLGAYVLAHPLANRLSPVPTPFAEPEFILLAGLLGVACLLLYRRSGSLWPPMALHWLVVTSWLALGGRGMFPTGA